jgi:hypothetical protein
MAIYRGPGGSGDATDDAASAAALVIQKVAEATASADAAALSADAASSSAASAAISAASASASATAAAGFVPSVTGNAGKYLTTDGSVTSWSTVDALPSQTGNNGKYLTTNGSAASWVTVDVGVTSVALTAPTGLTVSGSPVTSTGTLALSYTAGYSIPTDTKQTNWDTAYGWGNHASAGYLTTSVAASTYAPLTGTGASGTWGISITGNAATVTNGLYSNVSYSNPTWLTSISGSIVSGNISGNAANVTGTVAIANGGTGQTTQQAAINALTGTQSSGKYLRSDGTNASLASIQAADVPTLNQNTTGTAANITATTNSTLTTLSALSLPGSQVSGNISGNAANVTGTVAIANGGSGQTTAQAAMNAFAGAVTSGSYLRGNGTNVVMATIQAADVPTLNQNTTGTAGGLSGTPNITVGTVNGTTITASTQFSGPGTGLTGTASSLSIGGNAATVTNGIYTTGSYSDPTWLTTLAGSKITGTINGGTY